MFRSALRFVAGAAAGSLVWLLLTPAYNSVLAFAAQPLLRIDPRLRGVEVRGLEDRVQARGGEERLGLPRVVIPAGQLTYNLVLFAGLFATERGLFRGRAFRRFLAALLALMATHVLAFVVSIEATFATRLGTWSDTNYSALLQDFWNSAEYAYRLAGMFAIAFGLWWVTDPSAFRRSRERSAA